MGPCSKKETFLPKRKFLSILQYAKELDSCVAGIGCTLMSYHQLLAVLESMSYINCSSNSMGHSAYVLCYPD